LRCARMTRCPRCATGCLLLETDRYGAAMVCLQCAHTIDLDWRGQPVAGTLPHSKPPNPPGKRLRAGGVML